MRSSTLACADTVLDRVSEKLSVRSSQHRATAAQKQQQIGHRELDLEERGHQRGSARESALDGPFRFHVSRAQRARPSRLCTPTPSFYIPRAPRRAAGSPLAFHSGPLRPPTHRYTRFFSVLKKRKSRSHFVALSTEQSLRLFIFTRILFPPFFHFSRESPREPAENV